MPVLREVDLSRAVLARLSAGYLMALADSGLSRVPGSWQSTLQTTVDAT